MKKYISASDSFDKAIAQSICESIDGRHIAVFESLNNFINERLRANYQIHEIDSFGNFANIPIYYYEYAAKKYHGSVSHQEIYSICSEAAGRNLIETYSQIAFGNSSIEVSENEKRKFIDLLSSKCGDIIYLAIKYKDIRSLNFFLGRLNYVHIVYVNLQNKRAIDDIFALRSLEDQSEYQMNIGYANTQARIIFKVTRFWTYYLYNNDVFDYGDLLQTEAVFEQYNSYILEKQLPDIYHLRETSFAQDYSWRMWDYTERPDMEVYSPPSVMFWVTFGSLIYFLKKDETIRYDATDTSPENINAFGSFIFSLTEILRVLAKDGYEKWHVILGAKTREEYDRRISTFRNQIEYLHQTNVTAKERAIANLPLSANWVTKFKNTLVNSWRETNSMRKLFDHFKNEKVDTSTEGLYLGGWKNILMEDWKKCFVDDINYHVPIGNIDLFGNRLSRWEENVFFRELINENRISTKDDVLAVIDRAIKNICTGNFKPTVILLGNDIWASTFAKLKHPNFRLNREDRNEFPFHAYGGYYRAIPLVPFADNPLFSNNIIIADFYNSFLMNKYLENHKPITVDVRFIEDNEAADIIEKNREYWTKNLSFDQAIVRVKNAVRLDLYTYLKFRVRENKAFNLITFDHGLNNSNV